MIRVLKFLSILTLLLNYGSAVAVISPSFQKLPTEDIIRDVYSFCVFQDSRGIIWACTQNGLIYYDGEIVKVYRHQQNNNNSLSSNIVRDVAEDKNGNLWIATINGGLDKLDPRTEQFTHFVQSDNDPASLSSNQVWSLYIDNNVLWIGTYNNGLNSLAIESEIITRYPELKTVANAALGRISSIASSVNRDASILIGTDNGLYIFDTNTHELSPFNDANFFEKTSQTTIWSIQHADGALLLATSDGLYRLENGSFTRYANSGNSTATLPGDDIRSVVTDKEGGMWLATAGSGLAYMTQDGKTISLHSSSSNPNSLPYDAIWQIMRSRDGMLWVATTRGIASFNPAARNFSILDKNWLDPALKDELYISAVLGDSKENLWLSSNYGLLMLDKARTLQHIPTSFPSTDKDLFVHEMLEDDNGTIWIASSRFGLLRVEKASGGQLVLVKAAGGCCASAAALEKLDTTKILVGAEPVGLEIYNIKTGQSRSFAATTGRLTISKIINLQNGYALLGAYSGVFSINLKSGEIHDLSGNNPQLKDIFVLDILQTSENDFYIASDNGLFYLTKQSHPDSYVAEPIKLAESGDSEPVIFSVAKSKDGTLWLGAATRLIAFQPGKPPVHFHEYDGLPMSAFARGAAVYDTNSRNLYFGGKSGLLSFHEFVPSPEDTPPDALITSIVFHNENDNSITKKLFGSSIILNYYQKNLVVNFTALSYLAPKRNRYAYRLSGYSNNWIETGEIGQVTFTNLDPGQYTLEVKAKTARSAWSAEPATLEITIIAPWWRSNLAYTGYFLLGILLLGGFAVSQNRRVAAARAISRKLQEADALRSHFVAELETQVEKSTADLHDSMEALQIKNVELEIANKRAQDASQLKSRFLADMSHELRTPMNGILGFVELLEKTPLDKNQKDYTATIRQSGQMLLDLVANVLDIAKIESGKISLDERLFNLHVCLDETLTLLTPIAYDKGLELVCIVDPDLPDLLLGDPARIRQIITNLTGNAIKFTQHGSVCVRAILDKATNESIALTLAVSDTGIGINRNEQNRLFQTFSQANPDINRRFGGSGLGLSICKGLAEAMGGQIKIQSTPGVGSVFTIELSLLLPGNAAGHFLQEENDAIAWQPDSRFAKATVLLYDRHPLSIQAISSMLQTWGIRVIEVHDLDELRTELRRNNKRPRYNACLCALTMEDMQSTEELENLLQTERGKTPLLVLASTLSMDILCTLEVQWQAVCLPKNAGARIIHNTLSSILEEQPQFSRTSRDISNIQQNSSLGGLRILITDDNQANRDLLRQILRHHGAHTGEASGGPESLQRLSEESWDVVLLDIHMPGMSGIDVARELRQGDSPNRQIPIIAVTANALPEMRDWALTHGMNAYLIKPYSEEALLETLAVVLAPTATD